MASTPEIEQAIINASAKYRVEPEIIKAIIKRESDYKPSAVREEPKLNPPDASIGLMQVLVGTARWVMNDQSITRQMLYDIQFNVDVGTKYIAKQLSRYSGDIKKALASYNAGSARYKADGTTFINQDYVDYTYGWYLRYLDESGKSFGPAMPPMVAEPSIEDSNTGTIIGLIIAGVAAVIFLGR